MIGNTSPTMFHPISIVHRSSSDQISTRDQKTRGFTIHCKTYSIPTYHLSLVIESSVCLFIHGVGAAVGRGMSLYLADWQLLSYRPSCSLSSLSHGLYMRTNRIDSIVSRTH